MGQQPSLSEMMRWEETGQQPIFLFPVRSGTATESVGDDALSRIASATNPSRPGDGLNFTTTYSYDPLGRTTSAQTADGSTTATLYSGNQATTTDAAGKQRKLVYDALGRLTYAFEDPSGANYITYYGYDALDDLTSVTQGYCPNCQGRSFVYDSLKRMTKAINPESGTVSYEYDNAGNLVKRTDNRNVVTTYTYDNLNRLYQKRYSDSTLQATFIYDGLHVPYGTGRLFSVNNGYSSLNILAYDALGRVTLNNQQTSQESYSFSYTYNLAGALTSETYPSGRTITTTYDPANRVSQITGALTSNQKTYLSDMNWAAGGK